MKGWEWRLLGALTLLSLVVHFHFRIHGFGEQDEARLGLYAIDWRAHGVFATDTYLNRTSPLYLMALGFALDHGLPTSAMADALNVVNVAFGSLSLVPMFLLFRLLTRAPQTAFLAVGVYWFAPAYWYGQGYGMPHIPALVFFLTSVYCFGRALTSPALASPALTSPALDARWLTAAAVASAVAGALKSDIVLCGLAFPTLVLCFGPVTRRRLLWGALLPVFGVAASLLLSRAFLPVPVSATAFATAWNEQFPFDLGALFDRGHASITTRALGTVLWAAAAVGLLANVLPRGRSADETRAGRRLALLSAAWALPTIFFWGMIWAHAARHLAAALVPVALLAVTGVRSLLGSAPRTVAVFAAIVVANYFSARPSNHPHLAGPRLFASRQLMQELTDHFMQSGRDFAQARAERKLLLGGGAVPYCELAVIERAQAFSRRITTPGTLWDLDVTAPGGGVAHVRIRRGPQPTPERNEPGWLVWNAELGAVP